MAVIASVFAVMLLGRGMFHLINLSIMIVSSESHLLLIETLLIGNQSEI
jgi:hypothetical protein